MARLVVLVCIASTATLASVILFSTYIFNAVYLRHRQPSTFHTHRAHARAISLPPSSYKLGNTMNRCGQMKDSYTQEQLLQDRVTWSLGSLADIALPNISQVHVSDIAAVTQSGNLEKRSEWQRDQVNKYCQKYGLKRQLYVLPCDNRERYMLYRHLIYDSRKKLIFCKVGCTTLRRLIFVMQGAIPLQSVNWTHVSETEYLRPAMQRASFLNTQLTDGMKLQKLKNYFKFVMIRNPLERLVSAYCDKIEPPLELCDHDKWLDPLVTDIHRGLNMDHFQAYRRLILSKYRPHLLREWAQSNANYSLSVDFTTYVKWITDTEDRDLNEHFSSILFNAAPCRVRYHLYLNFKNYSREVRLLIEKLNTNSEYFIDHNSHGTVQDETHSKLPYYYSQLSDEMKRELFVRMYTELDFYYHLYPEERWSHVALLGTNK